MWMVSWSWSPITQNNYTWLKLCLSLLKLNSEQYFLLILYTLLMVFEDEGVTQPVHVGIYLN